MVVDFLAEGYSSRVFLRLIRGSKKVACQHCFEHVSGGNACPI